MDLPLSTELRLANCLILLRRDSYACASVLHLVCAVHRLVLSAISSKRLNAFLMRKDDPFQLLLTSLGLASQIFLLLFKYGGYSSTAPLQYPVIQPIFLKNYL